MDQQDSRSDFLSKLTPCQKQAYVISMSGTNCFITGGAGVGKSFVTRLIIASLRNSGRNVLVVAPTGIAATTIGGSTIHRAFSLPASPAINIKSMSIKSHASNVLCCTDTVIVDEISMCRMDIFDSIVTSIHKAERKGKRRIQLIVVGDFLQLPPILDSENGEKELLEAFYETTIISPFAFLSKSWDSCKFQTIILEDVMRQDDTDFINNLNSARTGDTNCIDYFNTQSAELPIANAITLFAYNSSANKENDKQLSLIDGIEYHIPTIIDDSLPAQDLQGIPKELTLKPGCRVVFMTNDNMNTEYSEDPTIDLRPWWDKQKYKPRYYNGTFGTVIEVNVDSTDHNNDSVTIQTDSSGPVICYRHNFNIYSYSVTEDRVIHREIVGKYSMIPLRLAYAMTIHHSQGQTYEKVNINPNCFSAGQLYVALSRAKNISHMYLTELIHNSYLITDPLVLDFYSKANNTKKEKAERKIISKGGRPKRYGNGSRVLRIPAEIADSLEKVISQAFPQGESKPDMEKYIQLRDFLNGSSESKN